MESTERERDIKARKASAWRALNNLRKIQTSNLSRGLKTQIFVAASKTILLYSCEAWTLTAALIKSVDEHITNKELYSDLPKISDKVAA